MTQSYERYLKRSFYEAFSFKGTPIRILKRKRTHDE
jgi:predicted GTPase